MNHGLVQVAILVAVGVAVGLTFNAVSPQGVPVAGGQEQRLEKDGIHKFTLEELRAAAQKPGTVILDARDPEEYQLGHIPGALNLPADTFITAYPPLAKTLAGAKSIITYCSGPGCLKSEIVAKKLVEEEGMKDGRVGMFEAGFPAWMRAKLPIATGTGH